jgi:DNA-directed RNA polymerase subunit H (RpoH/RPB5)
MHNKTKATVDNAQAANADEEEERLLAERRAAEEAEDAPKIEEAEHAFRHFGEKSGEVVGV